MWCLKNEFDENKIIQYSLLSIGDILEALNCAKIFLHLLLYCDKILDANFEKNISNKHGIYQCDS